MDLKNLTSLALQASAAGAAEILSVYDQADFSVETKGDQSPLTEADKRAHLAIVKILQTSGLPILSEEGKNIPYDERKNWDTFWLVDPLDGTKEFIKRNGEFTVNIALVQNSKVIAGVIWVPVTGVIYAGINGTGAWKHEPGKYPLTAEILADFDSFTQVSLEIPQSSLPETYTLVASRSHMSPETETYIKEIEQQQGQVNLISSGSSLKLCLVAEGAAHEYPRFAPTMEWDTAAGQAIAEAAGKKVYQWPELTPVTYNKENLLNPWFLVK